jgi:hypothetical protein
MDNGKRSSLWSVMFFITLVFVNWLYVGWVEYVSAGVSSAWLTMLPFFAYVYFSFTVIASIELSHKTCFGLVLACCVILFGIISDVMSYMLVLNDASYFQTVLILLLAVNLAALFSLIYYSGNFKS